MAALSLAAAYTYSDSEGSDESSNSRAKETVKTEVSYGTNNVGVKSLVSYLEETLDSEEEEGALLRASEVTSLNRSSTSTTAEDENEASASNATVFEVGNISNSTATRPSFKTLPPEPRSKCSADLQRRIEQFTQQMDRNGTDINELIQKRKNFRNPSIYEKMVQYCNVDEFGTNYQPNLYDPKIWSAALSYENLRKAQDEVMATRLQKSKVSGKVTFTKRPVIMYEDNSVTKKPRIEVQVEK